MKYIKIVIILYLCILISACAAKRSYEIRSYPVKASVKINKRNKGVTPIRTELSFSKDKPEYTIEVSKRGYESKVFTLTEDYNGVFKEKEDDLNQYLTIPLQPITKEMSVKTTPGGADISVNEVYEGTTPKMVKLVYGEKRKNTIRVSKLGYEDSTAVIPLDYKDDAHLNILLQPVTKELLVETEPEGADISVNETNLGTTPITVKLTYGEKKENIIRVSKIGYEDNSETISLDYDGYRVSIPLKSVSKEITVKSEPADATIIIDKTYIGKTPKKVKLLFGDKQENFITVSEYGYEKAIKRITLNYKLDSVFIKLSEKPTRKMAYIKSDVEENKITFKAVYEEAYKDTSERSPNATQLNMVGQVADINILISEMGATKDYLVFAKISPKSKINMKGYVTKTESLKSTLNSLHAIAESGKKDASKIVDLIDRIEKDFILKESVTDELYKNLINILNDIKAEKDVNNYLDTLDEITNFIAADLHDMMTFDTNEFYSEIWAANLKQNFKMTKISHADMKWIDVSPTIHKNTVYFSSNRNSKDFEIWRANIGEGRGLAKITNSPYSQDMSPVISDRGDFLSYSSLPMGAKEQQIWTINTDGTLPSQLKIGVPSSICSDKIAFSKRSLQGKDQLWLINSNGSQETIVSANVNANNNDPSFSPDCKWLAFTSDESGNRDIWIMKVNGSNRTQLTTNASTDFHPVWGKDNFIYFVSNRGLLWGIWRLMPKALR